MKATSIAVIAFFAASTLAQPIVILKGSTISPRDIATVELTDLEARKVNWHKVGGFFKKAAKFGASLLFKRSEDGHYFLEARDIYDNVVGDLLVRDFDEEDLEARDFDDVLEAREFDDNEFEARDFDDLLEARDFDDEYLEARDFDDEYLEERDFDDEDLEARDLESNLEERSLGGSVLRGVGKAAKKSPKSGKIGHARPITGGRKGGPKRPVARPNAGPKRIAQRPASTPKRPAARPGAKRPATRPAQRPAQHQPSVLEKVGDGVGKAFDVADKVMNFLD